MKIKEYLMIEQKGRNKLVVNRIIKEKNIKENSPKEIIKFMNKHYYYNCLTEEYSYIFAYKNDRIIGIFQLSHGTDSSCDMDMQVIFKYLLLIGADSFIICHNHPQCSSKMSQDDYNRTMELITLSKYLRINLIAHIIVGTNEWRCVDKEVIEMASMKISDVNEYYERK